MFVIPEELSNFANNSVDFTILGYMSSRSDNSSDTPNGPVKALPFALFLRVLVAPRGGWKAVRRSAIPIDRMNAGALYPLLAVVAAAAFMQLFYDTNATVSSCLISAIIVFLSFFITQFVVLPLLSLCLPFEEKSLCKKLYTRSLVSLALSIEVFFYIIYELLPLLEPMLTFFAPLILIYSVTEGVKRMRAPENLNTRIIIILSILLLGIPLLASLILEPMLMSAV